MRLVFSLLILAVVAHASAPLAGGPAIDQLAMRLRILQAAPSLAQSRLGSSAYALVDEAQLSDLVADCWVLLRKQGIMITPYGDRSGWRARFNCSDITAAFILTARLRHSREGESEGHPAIFAVGYIQDSRTGLTMGQRQQARCHSVAMVFTPTTVVFIDPAIGRVALSPTECSTLFWYIQ